MAEFQRYTNILEYGAEIQEGVYQLYRFIENANYYDPHRHRWIGSVGQRISDGRIFAAIDTRYADSPNYSCLFLRS